MFYRLNSDPESRGARRIALAAASCAVSALFVGCKHNDAPPPAAVTPASTAHTAVDVSTSMAIAENISDTANLTGALGALNDITVGVKNPGKLVGVYAREGDHVTAGEVVAQQDMTDLQSQIAQARANLRSSMTRLDQANVAYSSAVATLKITDETTGSAVDQASAALKSAQDSLILIQRGARKQELQQAARTVDAAQADLESAKADAAQAANDLKRYEALYNQRAISAQQLDQARTVKTSADARVRSSAAHLDSAKQANSLLKEGAQAEDIHRSRTMVDQAEQALKTATSNRALVQVRKDDVESAKSAIDTAKAGVDVSKAQLAIAEQALRDSAIRSPIDGVVAERKAEPGAQLAVTRPDIMRIVSLNSLYFDGQLPQNLAGDVKVGMPVTVSVDSQPGKEQLAKITRIFPVASATARSFTVRVSLTNATGALRPQMFARGKLTLGTHPHAVVVPRDGVIEYQDNGITREGSVFLVVDGHAVKKKVHIGYVTVMHDEVLSGVSLGDKVITTGQAQVQDGDAVKIVDAPRGDSDR